MSFPCLRQLKKGGSSIPTVPSQLNSLNNCRVPQSVLKTSALFVKMSFDLFVAFLSPVSTLTHSLSLLFQDLSPFERK